MKLMPNRPSLCESLHTRVAAAEADECRSALVTRKYGLQAIYCVHVQSSDSRFWAVIQSQAGQPYQMIGKDKGAPDSKDIASDLASIVLVTWHHGCRTRGHQTRWIQPWI